jgi:NAD(P)-dependent dehydrogenase (short-subunit alcohol dehydrogenase family)
LAKIFITGSSDGIGLLAAEILLGKGAEVVLHARNKQRAKEVLEKFETKPKILVADLLDIDQIENLAEEVNALGDFNAVIHNAGVYKSTNKEIFQMNLLAPYLLTNLIKRPKRLIYIGSNMHPGGKLDIDDLSLEKGIDYSTSKLYILMLCLALARRWKDTCINTVDPGWVPTKMANYNAPDSLEEGSATQAWLAWDKNIDFTGKYLFHLKERSYFPKADDELLQEKLLKKLEEISGIAQIRQNI